TYAFDAFGNHTSMTVGAAQTTYAYDDADRLTTVTPPSPASAVSYTWDDNGSLTARGSDSFAWDYEERMTSATVNSVTTTFAYRGDGLRDSRTTNSVTTGFTWDIAAGLPVVIDDGNRYVYGAGLEAQIDGSDTYYYLGDGLGSTMAMVDSTGTVQKSYTYDVYGKPTATGSLPNEFDFAGQQTDPTGLQYLRARYMDPETGVFLSREPLAVVPGWTGNHYGYGAGNPARLSDPTGLRVCDDTGGPCTGPVYGGSSGSGSSEPPPPPPGGVVAQTCGTPTTPTAAGSTPNCTDNRNPNPSGKAPDFGWGAVAAFGSLVGEYVERGLRAYGQNEIDIMEGKAAAGQAAIDAVQACMRDGECNLGVNLTFAAAAVVISVVAVTLPVSGTVILVASVTVTVGGAVWNIVQYFETNGSGSASPTPTPTPGGT
ncbi:MAG: RHS repeat-associated core domain-containing protein, partial [Acidimicrobiales bacterium]